MAVFHRYKATTSERMQLITPHGRELAMTTVQSFPVLATALAGFALAIGAVFVSTRMRRLLPRP